MSIMRQTDSKPVRSMMLCCLFLLVSSFPVFTRCVAGAFFEKPVDIDSIESITVKDVEIQIK